jgi:altronate hydrolase
MKPRATILQIHPKDNVAVALSDISLGQDVGKVTAKENVPAGHKLALRMIHKGEAIVKYGYPIGVARIDIQEGEFVHVHNVASAMAEKLELGGYEAQGEGNLKRSETAVSPEAASFEGFRRPDGSVGIRNEIWIINTVGCVNHAATRIAERATRELVREGSAIEGIYTFNHPFGCSQLGDDLAQTQLLLSGLAKHPNAAGVLVLGLGCENNRLASFMEFVEKDAADRVRYFNAQDVLDELDTGVQRIHELAEYAGQFRRESIPASELILGMKCGGSDGLSGITANPLVGRIADRLATNGGTSILTEVPEMFGAEKILLERAVNAAVYDGTINMVNAFREYFRRHNEPIDENPSPGNKDGGITTLAEKSLGCVQKAGTFSIKQVLDYGQQASPGLGGIALLNGPGNDGVSGSALSAAGAHMVLFTTGRGTPMGFPVPTLKIATNSSLTERKPGWIDFGAGPLADGTADMDTLTDDLFALVLDIASGRKHAKSEINGYREIAIWKDGVTL